MSESAFIHLIKIFDGSGYDEGRKLVKDMLQKRLHKGGIWIKTLQHFIHMDLMNVKESLILAVSIFAIKRFNQ